eukprot:jgi/Mesen1/7067/ME000369S06390
MSGETDRNIGLGSAGEDDDLPTIPLNDEDGQGNEVERIDKFARSEVFVQRLYHVCYMAEAAQRAGYEGSAGVFVPLCRELSVDKEPEIRQALAEQLPQLARVFSMEGSDEAMHDITVLLETANTLLTDGCEEVQLAAEQAFSEMAHVAGDKMEDNFLKIVLNLAASREEGQRVCAANLLTGFAEGLRVRPFEERVVPAMVGLASDSEFRVRKAVALGLPRCCKALAAQVGLVEASLLPVYITLAQDTVWAVRMACAEGIVRIAEVVSPQARASLLAATIEQLARDPSNWVRDNALQMLGPFLSKLHGTEELSQRLVALFTSMAEPFPHDNRLRLYCAFNFPAVVQSLGPERWLELEGAYKSLLSSEQAPVRRTLGYSLHELAQVLGKDLTKASLLPAFKHFMTDIDEVRLGVAKHFVLFLATLPKESRLECLQMLSVVLWNGRSPLPGRPPPAANVAASGAPGGGAVDSPRPKQTRREEGDTCGNAQVSEGEPAIGGAQAPGEATGEPEEIGEDEGEHAEERQGEGATGRTEEEEVADGRAEAPAGGAGAEVEDQGQSSDVRSGGGSKSGPGHKAGSADDRRAEEATGASCSDEEPPPPGEQNVRGADVGVGAVGQEPGTGSEAGAGARSEPEAVEGRGEGEGAEEQGHEGGKGVGAADAAWFEEDGGSHAPPTGSAGAKKDDFKLQEKPPLLTAGRNGGSGSGDGRSRSGEKSVALGSTKSPQGVRVVDCRSLWHLRSLIAEQVNDMTGLLELSEINSLLLPFTLDLCRDPIAAVRMEAAKQVGALVSLLVRVPDEGASTATDPSAGAGAGEAAVGVGVGVGGGGGVTKDGQAALLAVQQLAVSGRFRDRQMFAVACLELAKGLPAPIFVQYLLPALQAAAKDPVVNVRILVARSLAEIATLSEELSAAPDLQATLSTLRADTDADVSFASLHHPPAEPEERPPLFPPAVDATEDDEGKPVDKGEDTKIHTAALPSPESSSPDEGDLTDIEQSLKNVSLGENDRQIVGENSTGSSPDQIDAGVGEQGEKKQPPSSIRFEDTSMPELPADELI